MLKFNTIIGNNSNLDLTQNTIKGSFGYIRFSNDVDHATRDNIIRLIKSFLVIGNLDVVIVDGNLSINAHQYGVFSAEEFDEFVMNHMRNVKQRIDEGNFDSKHQDLFIKQIEEDGLDLLYSFDVDNVSYAVAAPKGWGNMTSTELSETAFNYYIHC